MAIRSTHKTNQHKGLIFPKHQPTLGYCIGQGIELGAGAHNHFGLQGAINVAPGDDLEIFRAMEIEMCGSYAEIDIVAEANDLPFNDATQDFVVSSHVLEHLPNPIGAFLEWNRILKVKGIVVMIVPLPGAHPPDVGRPIVRVEELQSTYNANYTVDDNPLEQVRRGHYYVYTLERMLEAIYWMNNELYPFYWHIELTEAKDSKVGNGFCIIARKI